MRRATPLKCTWTFLLAGLMGAAPGMAGGPGRFAVDTYVHGGELRSIAKDGRVDAMRQLSVMNIGVGARLGAGGFVRAGAGSLVGIIGPHLEASLGAEYHFMGADQSGPFARAGARWVFGAGRVCVNRQPICRQALDASLAKEGYPSGSGFVGELGLGAQIRAGRVLLLGSGAYQRGQLRSPSGSGMGELRQGIYHGWLASITARLFL